MGNARLHPKMSGKVLCVLIGLLLSTGLAYAQSRVKTGHVTDENGKPLPGVSVTIKGQKTGTTTDDNGNFQISADGNPRLVFSFVGYTAQEIAASQAGTISLKPSRTNIDSLVVVG